MSGLVAPPANQPPTITAPPTTGGPPKPVFPAYQQQLPSSDPNSVAAAGGGGSAGAIAAPMAPTLPEVNRRPAEKVPSVGAGCKLMHPEDDLSLVSVCHNTLVKFIFIWITPFPQTHMVYVPPPQSLIIICALWHNTVHTWMCRVIARWVDLVCLKLQEEIRSQLLKYRTAKGPPVGHHPGPPPQNPVPGSGHPPPQPTIAAMPIIRPGMGPPGMAMHPPPRMPPPNFQHPPRPTLPPMGQIRPYM